MNISDIVIVFYCVIKFRNNALNRLFLFCEPDRFSLVLLIGLALLSAAAKLEEMEVDVGCSSGELNELTLLGRHLSLQHAYGLGAYPILFNRTICVNFSDSILALSYYYLSLSLSSDFHLTLI